MSQLNRPNGIFGDMPDVYSAFLNDTGFIKSNRVNELVFTDPANTTPLTTLKASPLATNYTLTLPPSIGLNGQTLTVNAIGELEWKSVGGSFSLPTASDSVLGGVKIQTASGLALSGDDLEFSFNKSIIPTSTTTFDIGSSANRVNKLYASEIDSSTSVKIGNCILAGNSGTNFTFSLPTSLPASQKLLGIDETGQISYQDGGGGALAAATSSALGGVIVPSGKNLSLDASGNIGFEFSSTIEPTAALLAIGSLAAPLGEIYTIQVKASQFVKINESIIYGSSSVTSFTLPDYTFGFPSSVGASGQVLQTDGDGTSSWVTRAVALGDLTDVAISTQVAGQFLKYNGSSWENGYADRTYDLGEGASGGWSAAGPGFTGANNNPTIYVLPGETYVFTTALSGHPPVVKQYTASVGDPYTVVATGTANHVSWSVPMDATLSQYCVFSSNDDGKKLILQCDKIHSTNPGDSVTTVYAARYKTNTSSGISLYSSANNEMARVQEGKMTILQSGTQTNSSPFVVIGINPDMKINNSSSIFYFPTDNGTSGYVLQTDGAGATSWVAPSGGATTLSALTDTNISGQSDADVLTWDNASSKWIPQAPSGGGGASTLVALTDTELPAVNSTPDTGYLTSTNTMVYPKYPVAWNPNTDQFEIAYGIESGYNYRASLQATGGKVNRVCIGRLSAAYGDDSVCIGNGHTNWTSTESIAIGGGSKGKNDGGSWVPNTHYDYTACFDAKYAIAIGSPTTVKGDYSIAMGCESSALKPCCTVIGYDSFSDSSGGIAIGYKAKTNGDNQIVINASHSTGLTAGSSSDSLYINPIRNDVSAVTNSVLKYDTTSKEVSHSTLLGNLSSPPANATDIGSQGEIRADANYIYVCTATDTWKRAALSTWS